MTPRIAACAASKMAVLGCADRARENRPYVVTHVPNRPHVDARFRALLDAFARAAEV